MFFRAKGPKPKYLLPSLAAPPLSCHAPTPSPPAHAPPLYACSGVPTIVTPVLADQPANGALCQKLGIGMVSMQFAKVTPEGLAAALTKCSADQKMIQACAATYHYSPLHARRCYKHAPPVFTLT